MTDDRKLESLLNEALASYACQEPDAGLNARISAKVADAAPRSWRGWVSWRAGVFTSATACAAVVLFTLLDHPAHVQTPQPRSATATADRPQPLAIVNAEPPHGVPVHAALTIPRRVPHPNEVRVGEVRLPSRQNPRVHSRPAPPSLTPEESLLLKFATEHPEQARQLLTSTSRDNAPLEIKPLSIEPIHIAALADAESQQSHD